MRFRLSFGSVVFAVLCLYAPVAFSITIHVPADQPTIQAGIDAAVNGDTVLVAPGTYTGDGNRDIDFKGKAILVASENGPEYTIIDCQASFEDRYRGFKFVSGEDSSSRLIGFTIQNGAAPWVGSPRDENTGGGALIVSAAPIIENCIFNFNWGTFGGAVGIFWGSKPTFRNTKFQYNVVEFSGGAVWIEDSCECIFEHCAFTGNLSVEGVGGIASSGKSLDLIYCTFVGNGGADYNGAVSVYKSRLGIVNCTFAKNHSYAVSALKLLWAEVSISGSVFAFNDGQSTIESDSNTQITLSCTDIYGNIGGDWVGELVDFQGQYGNLSLNPLFCDSAAGVLSVHDNSPCLPSMNSCSALIGALGTGCTSTDVQDSTPLTVDDLIYIAQNYPNPFNSSTTFSFELLHSSGVRIEVFNTLGRRIAVPFSGGIRAGKHRIEWNGTDDAGHEMPTGLYLFRITAGTATKTLKLMILR